MCASVCVPTCECVHVDACVCVNAHASVHVHVRHYTGKYVCVCSSVTFLRVQVLESESKGECMQV